MGEDKGFWVKYFHHYADQNYNYGTLYMPQPCDMKYIFASNFKVYTCSPQQLRKCEHIPLQNNSEFRPPSLPSFLPLG